MEEITESRKENFIHQSVITNEIQAKYLKRRFRREILLVGVKGSMWRMSRAPHMSS